MRSIVVAICLLLLTSCGYVGPVQPPSPEIPTTIANLAAVERGDQIVVTFTTPPRTVDGVAITQFSHIDLRVFPATQAPESAPSIEVEPPPPSDREDPQPDAISYSTKADPFSGQQIAVTVRTAMRKNGHFSAWSNRAVLRVIPPLLKPVVTVQPSCEGAVLTWPSSDAAQFQILRQSPSDKQPIEIATVNEDKYTDVSAQSDTDYRYIVIARKETAESLPSAAVTINFPDIYAPAIPTGVTALAGPDSIELAWQRNTEPDLQGYYIYRSINNGPFERLGALITLPNYTDRAVEHGKTYAYKIAAIDKKTNLSGQSNPAEVSF